MDLAGNLENIRQCIARACERSGRDPSEVRLLPVSKSFQAEVVCVAAELGLEEFGENRVQEAKLKIGQCPARLRWHLIGHLQSNKCRDAVRCFQMIQSVDSFDLAGELNRHAEKQSRSVPVLIQVNVAGEASKFGYAPDALLKELDALNDLGRLEIHGLMTIAPWTPEPEKVRPVFRKLREIQKECEDILGAPLPDLSMGMSGDFEVAVEEGATIVRLGTALFGSRGRKKDD